MKRSGIGDDEQLGAPSEAEPLKVAAVALQILRRVGAEDPVRRQELVELAARGEAEELAQLGPAEMPLSELVERESFERPAPDIARAAETPSQFLGDAERDFQTGETTRQAVRGQRRV